MDSALGSTTLSEVERFPDPTTIAEAGSLLAPMPGAVVRIEVIEGARVTAGTPIVVLEAMKMEPRCGPQPMESLPLSRLSQAIRSSRVRFSPSCGAMSSKGDVIALDYPKLLADLRAESDFVIDRLTALAGDHWALPTPAQGWSIRDQVSHLAFFDDSTILALSDAREFRSHADELMAAGMDFPDRIAKQHRAMAPAMLLKWFIDSRRRLLSTFMVEDPRRRLLWFGPDISVASSATARLMETGRMVRTFTTPSASRIQQAPGCAASLISVWPHSLSRTPSMDCRYRTIRCGSNCAPRQASYGPGDHLTLRTELPEPQRISSSPSPSAETGAKPI